MKRRRNTPEATSAEKDNHRQRITRAFANLNITQPREFQFFLRVWGQSLQYAPSMVKQDENMVLLALQTDSSAIRYADPSLLNSTSFFKAACSMSPQHSEHIGKELRVNTNAIKQIIAHVPASFIYLNENIKANQSVVKFALTHSTDDKSTESLSPQTPHLIFNILPYLNQIELNKLSTLMYVTQLMHTIHESNHWLNNTVYPFQTGRERLKSAILATTRFNPNQQRKFLQFKHSAEFAAEQQHTAPQPSPYLRNKMIKLARTAFIESLQSQGSATTIKFIRDHELSQMNTLKSSGPKIPLQEQSVICNTHRLSLIFAIDNLIHGKKHYTDDAKLILEQEWSDSFNRAVFEPKKGQSLKNYLTRQ